MNSWVEYLIDLNPGTPRDVLWKSIDLPPYLSLSYEPRQSQFIAGRICAARGIEKLTGHLDIPAWNDDESPRWPEGIVGSIAHTDNHAIAVVGRSHAFTSLGVDIESLAVDEAVIRSIESEVLVGGEMNLFSSMDQNTHKQNMLSVFCIKEAVFKCLYPVVQELFDFDAVEVVDPDLMYGRNQIRIRKNFSPTLNLEYLSCRVRLQNNLVYVVVNI